MLFRISRTDNTLHTNNSPINAHIFRAYDIRGLAMSEVSPAIAYRLGRTFPLWLNKPHNTVAVSRDVRLSGPILQHALMQGLLDAGVDVIDLGMVATPLNYFSAFHCNVAACIQVTASHNPARDNGFKIMLGQQSFHGEALQQLRMRMQQTPPPPNAKRGKRSYHNILPTYLKTITPDCRLARPITVVVDAGNGPAGLMAIPLYQNIGCNVIPLYCEPDGHFPHHHPDPSKPANLQDLIQAVREHQADIGLAFDGDGDRIGMVDEQGNIISPDMILLILARALLQQHPGATIIAESKSSNRLYEGIEQAGGTALMWHTGHALIKQKMQETGALLAGEVSGHIFFADRFYGYDDAIYAGARLLHILAQEQHTASSLLHDVAETCITPEIRIPCPDSSKFDIVHRAQQHFAQLGLDIINLDGIRIIWPHGWALLRASNTQAILVIRVEADSMEHMQTMYRTLTTWLNGVGIATDDE